LEARKGSRKRRVIRLENVAREKEKEKGRLLETLMKGEKGTS